MKTTPQKPEVGMGATYSINGDSYPYTIVAVKSPKKIVITRDDAEIVKGDVFNPIETKFTSRFDAPSEVITLRKNGRWYPLGSSMTPWGGYTIGSRYYRQDPHF